jgi:hypothetical protein
MAGLLTQLHLAGVYWGDCSLSNTLFRQDAGMLQAYLVDAETAEAGSARLSPTLRYHDLEIMEENIRGELMELISSADMHSAYFEGLPYAEAGRYVRQRYLVLWDEITREQVIHPDEGYRIQERIRALNQLGFSVKQVELLPSEGGEQLRLRVIVAGRNFHRDQLMSLTGIQAEEGQATRMLNEIVELQGYFTFVNGRSMQISAAAYYWLERVYLPTIDLMRSFIEALRARGEPVDLPELYIQILEHKWYLSEQSQRDVGHTAAAQDFIQKYS